MRILLTIGAGLAFALLVSFFGYGHFDAAAQVDSKDANIAVVDDCLPGDPGWNPTGGCTLRPQQGDVPAAEFFALLTSPLTIPPNGVSDWSSVVAQ
jgi:hypothetical protein